MKQEFKDQVKSDNKDTADKTIEIRIQERKKKKGWRFFFKNPNK